MQRQTLRTALNTYGRRCSSRYAPTPGASIGHATRQSVSPQHHTPVRLPMVTVRYCGWWPWWRRSSPQPSAERHTHIKSDANRRPPRTTVPRRTSTVDDVMHRTAQRHTEVQLVWVRVRVEARGEVEDGVGRTALHTLRRHVVTVSSTPPQHSAAASIHHDNTDTVT